MTDDELVFDQVSDNLLRFVKKQMDILVDVHGVDKRKAMALIGKAVLVMGGSLIGNSCGMEADSSLNLSKKSLRDFQNFIQEHKEELADAIVNQEAASET